MVPLFRIGCSASTQIPDDLRLILVEKSPKMTFITKEFLTEYNQKTFMRKNMWVKKYYTSGDLSLISQIAGVIYISAALIPTVEI